MPSIWKGIKKVMVWCDTCTETRSSSHIKTFIGSEKSLCSRVCKKVIGRQRSKGKVIAFKYQDTGLKEMKQGNGKALIAEKGSLKFLISGKASFTFWSL